MQNVRKLRPLKPLPHRVSRPRFPAAQGSAAPIGTDALNYDQIFDQAIERLHSEGRYRVFIDILRNKGAFPNARCFHGHNGPKPVTV